MKRQNTVVRCRLWVAAICISVAFGNSCLGHDEHVHQMITGAAFDSSHDLAAFLTDSLGASANQFFTGPEFIAHPHPIESNGGGMSPWFWLVSGSYYEDMTYYGFGLDGHQARRQWRCLDHFYIPWPSPHGLSDDSESPWYHPDLPDGIVDSYDWAKTKGIHGVSVPSVEFVNTETWPDARENQYLALIQTTRADREEHMALMLYALGHILHLNQDTSSPDHARNDSHHGQAHFEKFGRKNYLADANRSPARRAILFPLVPPENRGWLRWRDAGFEKLEDFWDRHKYNGNAAALDADASGTAGEKLGLAEFSNGNFLGEDALYVEYFFGSNGKHYFPYPSLLLSTDFVQRRVQLAPGIFTTFLKDGTAV